MSHDNDRRTKEGANAEKGNLSVYISYLRKKIERDPSNPELLITEPGLG